MNYATPNQGLAAFLLTIGQKVESIDKRPSKRYESDSYFFVFEVDADKGREMATDFYEKKALIDPFVYYENMKSLREMLRDTRAKEA